MLVIANYSNPDQAEVDDDNAVDEPEGLVIQALLLTFLLPTVSHCLVH